MRLNNCPDLNHALNICELIKLIELYVGCEVSQKAYPKIQFTSLFFTKAHNLIEI